MKARYFVLPGADRDPDEIADGLAEAAGVPLALRSLEAAHATFELLATQPRMGWQCRLKHKELRGMRQFLVRTPFEKYVVFYRAGRGPVEVVRVLHGAQDLGSKLGAGAGAS